MVRGFDIDKNFTSERFLFRNCDMADLNQVRQFGMWIVSLNRTIDIIVNNAGVISDAYKETKQGLEWVMGVNHFSHHLLGDLIFPHLANKARIINVSSTASHWIDNSSKTVNDFDEYFSTTKN